MMELHPIFVLCGWPVVEFALISEKGNSNEREHQGEVMHEPILLTTEHR
jgi:hypothetical protein